MMPTIATMTAPPMAPTTNPENMATPWEQHAVRSARSYISARAWGAVSAALTGAVAGLLPIAGISRTVERRVPMRRQRYRLWRQVSARGGGGSMRGLLGRVEREHEALILGHPAMHFGLVGALARDPRERAL